MRKLTKINYSDKTSYSLFIFCTKWFQASGLWGTILKTGTMKAPFLVSSSGFKTVRKVSFSQTNPLGKIILCNLCFVSISLVNHTLSMFSKALQTYSKQF